MTPRSSRESPTGATTALVGELNRAIVLELLQSHGTLSRTDLARLSGLSAATVTRLVAGLLRERLILDLGESPSTGGRPARRLTFNERVGSVLSLVISAEGARGAIFDLNANELHAEEKTTRWRHLSAPSGATVLTSFFEHLVDKAAALGSPARGASIAIPGVVRDGVVEWAPSLGWRDSRLASDYLRTELPVVLENDVNMIAVGERRFGAGRAASSMIVIALDTEIGAGVVIAGDLVRGAHNSAGEIGYVLTSPDALRHRYPEFGDLESRVTGEGLVEQARDAGLADTTAAAVFQAATRGDADALRLAEQAVEHLTVAIANMAALVDPELIVLSGPVGHAIEPWIASMMRNLEGRIPHVPQIVVSTLGMQAALLGGAALSIEKSSIPQLLVRGAESTLHTPSMTGGS